MGKATLKLCTTVTDFLDIILNVCITLLTFLLSDMYMVSCIKVRYVMAKAIRRRRYLKTYNNLTKVKLIPTQYKSNSLLVGTLINE